MKMFLITLLSILTSINSFATGTDYVACRASNSDEYDISLEFVNNKISATSTLETDFKTYTPVENSEIISVVYLDEYDTEFGYDLSLKNSTLQKIQLVAWSRGHDSDNYYGSPSPVATECHLLKTKPANSVLVGENVQGYVSIEKL